MLRNSLTTAIKPIGRSMSNSAKSSGQWSKQSGDWSAALANYAEADPSTIPGNEIKSWNDQTMTIYDGYEKAKYHYLILPRCNFPLKDQTGSSSSSKPPMLSASDGKLSFGSTSSGKTVPNSHLASLNDLLKSPHAAEVLKSLELASDELIQEIEQTMRDTASPHDRGKKIGSSWGVMRGFHAVPSMKHVHLHVISKDLVADRLKHKKHYLSFKPDHGFFLHLETIQEYVRRGMTSLPKSPKAYEELLTKPLSSFHNQVTYKNMPELKRHLMLAWQAQVKQMSEESARRTAGRAEASTPEAALTAGARKHEESRGEHSERKRAKIGDTSLDEAREQTPAEKS